MPKSKRDKEISLTKVQKKKKTRDAKENLVDEIRNCVTKHSSIYVLSLENLRSVKFLQVRQHFKSNSELYYGKNNLMGVALGRGEEDEVDKDVHKISEVLKGECALMFTNEEPSTIKKYFNDFSEADYARAGTVVDEEVMLPEGPVPDLAGTMEPYLRKLGLPTKLARGVIQLTEDYVICKAGDTLTPDQASILKLFDKKTILFKITLRARWIREKGFKLLG